MKKHIGLTLAIALAIFNLAKPQSPPAWGFAPPLTVTTSGNTLTYHTTNYISNNAESVQIPNMLWHAEAEGVGIYVNTSGDCIGITYDPTVAPSGAFKSGSIGSYGASMSIGVNAGVAYYHNEYFFMAGIYDPFLQTWKKIGQQNTRFFDRTEDGMVLWRNDRNEFVLSIYDPALGVWVSHYLYEDSYEDFQIESNIALIRTDYGSLTGFAYDFEDHLWYDNYLVYSHSQAVMEGGVISWANSSRDKLGGAVYDFDVHDWVEFEIPVTGSGITNMGSNEGTVYYHNQSGIHLVGYDPDTHEWIEGNYTKAKCSLYEYHPNPNPRCFSFVTAYNIGGNVTQITCTDGHNLNRPRAFKPLLTQGNFALRCTLTNLVSQSICEQNVSCGNTLQAAEGAFTKLDIFPNPTSVAQGINITSPKSMARIQLTNLLGIKVAEMHPTGMVAHLDLPLTLPSGTYVLEVMLPKGEMVRRKVEIQ